MASDAAKRLQDAKDLLIRWINPEKPQMRISDAELTNALMLVINDSVDTVIRNTRNHNSVLQRENANALNNDVKEGQRNATEWKTPTSEFLPVVCNATVLLKTMEEKLQNKTQAKGSTSNVFLSDVLHNLRNINKALAGVISEQLCREGSLSPERAEWYKQQIAESHSPRATREDKITMLERVRKTVIEQLEARKMVIEELKGQRMSPTMRAKVLLLSRPNSSKRFVSDEFREEGGTDARATSSKQRKQMKSAPPSQKNPKVDGWTQGRLVSLVMAFLMFGTGKCASIPQEPITFYVLDNYLKPIPGQPFNLTCIVGGPAAIPTIPSYVWYKDGKVIPDETEKILTFSSLTHDDDGNYVCGSSHVNTNASEPRLSKELPFHVLVPPVVHIQSNSSGFVITRAAGKNLVLICVVTQASPSIPENGYSWSHLPSPQGKRRLLAENGHTLTLGPLTRKDSGMYICEARNDKDLPRGQASVVVSINGKTPTFLQCMLQSVLLMVLPWVLLILLIAAVLVYFCNQKFKKWVDSFNQKFKKWVDSFKHCKTRPAEKEPDEEMDEMKLQIMRDFEGNSTEC